MITKLFKHARGKNLSIIKSVYLIFSCKYYNNFSNKKQESTLLKHANNKNLSIVQSAYLIFSCRYCRSFFNKRTKITTTHVTLIQFELKIEKETYWIEGKNIKI
jgi:hypothetical protein